MLNAWLALSQWACQTPTVVSVRHTVVNCVFKAWTALCIRLNVQHSNAVQPRSDKYPAPGMAVRHTR